MSDFLALLIKKKTVLDPTLMTFESMFGAEPKDPSAALSPYLGRLPAQVTGLEHAFDTGNGWCELKMWIRPGVGPYTNPRFYVRWIVSGSILIIG